MQKAKIETTNTTSVFLARYKYISFVLTMYRKEVLYFKIYDFAINEEVF